MVDVQLAKELVALAGRGIRAGRGLAVDHLQAKGLVGLVGTEGAGIQRAGDKFPERIEVLELRALGAVVVGGGVVHVGRQPDHVLHARILDALEQARHLQLAPLGRAVLAVGHGFPARDTLFILAVGHKQADGHVAGNQLPGGLAGLEPLDQPLDLRAAQQVGVGAFLGLQIGGVGAAVAAHVQHKHIGQRALRQHAVDALGLGRPKRADGRVLHEGALAAGGEQLDVLLGVGGVAQQALAAGVVVGDLVVVPLPDLRHFAAEGAHIRIHQVVAVAAPVFVQGFGHLGDFGRDQVLPQRAIGQAHFGQDGAVGIDGVAAVHEHVGVGLAHGFVDAHAAKVLVDAPALAGGVPAPHQAQALACRLVRGLRGAEMALLHRRAHVGAGKVFQRDAVENVLAGRQALQVDAARAVAAGQQVGAAHALALGKAGGGGPLQPHAGVAAGARPDDGAVGQHVTALHPRGQEGAGAVAGDGGRGGLGLQHLGQQPGAAQQGARSQSPTHESAAFHRAIPC